MREAQGCLLRERALAGRTVELNCRQDEKKSRTEVWSHSHARTPWIDVGTERAVDIIRWWGMLLKQQWAVWEHADKLREGQWCQGQSLYIQPLVPQLPLHPRLHGSTSDLIHSAPMRYICQTIKATLEATSISSLSTFLELRALLQAL
jgi:hypothetical protein